MLQKFIKNLLKKIGFQLVKNHVGFQIEWTPSLAKKHKIDLLEILVINELNSGWKGLIQIGANDGLQADPIRELIIKYNLKSLLVEPIPYIFERLQKNYSNHNIDVLFENSAILIDKASNKENISFFELIDNNRNSNNDLSGFSTTSYDRIKAIQQTIYGSEIKEHLVNYLTVDDLLNKYKIVETSLLVIDAEGLDIKLCKEFLRISSPPKIIYFEILDQPIFEINEIFEILINKGYKISGNISDIIAYKY
jgi:FkbM family methyltransferase